jgi:hypothetical protein
MNIYTPLIPTYLYIKKHSVTGLKYFGKTTKSNPYKYLGSGKHWKRHIKKHGKQFVKTIWLSEPYIDTSITEVALLISEHWDIVNSNEWANLIPENGINGGSLKGGTLSAEHKAKLSASHTGKKQNPHSDETKAKMSASNTGRTFSDEHKAKLSASHTGKKLSAETISKRTASRTGKKLSPE